MFFKLVTKQFHTALNQDSCPGDQRAVASPLHKSTELQETIHIFLRSLTFFYLGHKRGKIDGPHSAGWALSATLDLEEIGELERQRHHARRIIDHDHTGRAKPSTGFLQRIEIHGQIELIGCDHRKCRPTGKHRLDLTSSRYPSSTLGHKFPDRRTH